MATSVYFNGRQIAVPGSYTAVDTSGLQQVGLSASGVVAVIGTAVGGRPIQSMSRPSDLIRLSTAEQAAKTFVSGDLLEATNMLFAPSNDPNIASGASQVIAMKVNNATQASLTLNAAGGLPSITLLSQDWGAYTSQIAVNLVAGSSQGRFLSITQGSRTESVDNLGGTPQLSLQWTPPSGTPYSSVSAGVEKDGSLHAHGTIGYTFSGDAGTGGTGAALTLTCSAGDVGNTATVYGISGGTLSVDTVPLTGTSTSVPKQYSALFALKLSRPASANVTLAAGASTFATIASGASTAGAKAVSTPASTPSAQAPVNIDTGANAYQFVVEGIGLGGATVRELVQTTAGGIYKTTTAFATINAIYGGSLTGAVNIGMLMARATPTAQPTVGAYVSYFKSLPGFTATLLGGNPSVPSLGLDTTAADVAIVSTALSVSNDKASIVGWINANSQLVTATLGNGPAPANLSATTFLSGGTDGTSTFADWQNALNQLKAVRVNSIVLLTADPATAAALDAHCVYCNGVGRSERDGFVGLMNPALTDVPTKAQAKAQALALNTRNLRAIPQAITRYDSTGTLREFTPPFAACVAAGMQAGAGVGISLTYKYANVLNFRQDPIWAPGPDSQEMIQGGLLFLEQVDGVGMRWVRNVTTYLQSNLICYVEGSVNAAVNYATYTLRKNLEFAVGQPGFAGTVSAVKGMAISSLGQLVEAGVITAYNSLLITTQLDQLVLSVALAPSIPFNFVTTTIHLTTNNLSAAAN